MHAEIDVLDSYLKQLAIKLKIGGKGFIHHSNIGKYIDELEKGTIVRHWRAKTVTAEKFKKLSKKHGMHCESQELFNWGNKKGKNTDCFSVFRNVGETANTSQTRIISSDFMIESRYLKNLSTIY